MNLCGVGNPRELLLDCLKLLLGRREVLRWQAGVDGDGEVHATALAALLVGPFTTTHNTDSVRNVK